MAATNVARGMKALKAYKLSAHFQLHAYKLTGQLCVSGATVQLAEETAWRILSAVTGEMEKMVPKQTVAVEKLGLNGHIVSLSDAERITIEHAMTFKETREETARRLGISSPTLLSKIRKYNLQ